MKQEELKPMTPEELKDEATYGEKAFNDYTNNSNPEKVREAFRRHRQSKAAGRTHQKANVPKPEV